VDILFLSLVAGLATCAGSALVLLFGRPGPAFLAGLFGVAGGVMAGISAGELLPAAWRMGGSRALAGGAVAALAALAYFRRRWPAVAPSPARGYLRLGYLVAAAIALHDLPEGMAIALGAAARPELGAALALAIGLHNLPEGMVMAAPLVAGGLPAPKVLESAVLVALVTPLGAAVGLVAQYFLPVSIAPLLVVAAAAMLYVAGRELLPAALGHSPPFALAGLLMGLALWWAM
jgi:ZIP family zinc transporter